VPVRPRPQPWEEGQDPEDLLKEIEARGKWATEIAAAVASKRYVLVNLEPLYRALGAKVSERALERVMIQRYGFMDSGAAWLYQKIRYGEITRDEALDKLRAADRLARKLYRVLAEDYGLRFIVPRDVAGKVKFYVWANKDTREGVYLLNIYARFPYDVSKHSGKSEYEPVTVVFRRAADGSYVPLAVVTRVHWWGYTYYLGSRPGDIAILYLPTGHTPVVKRAEVLEARKGREEGRIPATALEGVLKGLAEAVGAGDTRVYVYPRESPVDYLLFPFRTLGFAVWRHLQEAAAYLKGTREIGAAEALEEGRVVFTPLLEPTDIPPFVEGREGLYPYSTRYLPQVN